MNDGGRLPDNNRQMTDGLAADGEASLPQRFLTRRSMMAIAVSLTISAATLFVIFQWVDPSATFSALRGVPAWAVGLLFVCAAVDIFGVASLRSWLALREFGYRIPFHEVLFARTAVTPAVMFLPLQTGELPYIAWLNRVKKVPLTSAGAVILSEKYATVLALLELGCLAGIWLDLPIPPVVFWAALAAVSLLLHPRVIGWALRRAARLSRKYRETLEKAADDLGRMSVPGMLRLNLVAILLHVNVGLFSWLCFRLLNVDVPVIAAILLWPVTFVLSAAPVTMGGMGLREAVFVLVYGAYGTDSAILGAALLFSATAMPVHLAPIVWFFPTLVGKIVGATIKNT